VLLSGAAIATVPAQDPAPAAPAGAAEAAAPAEAAEAATAPTATPAATTPAAAAARIAAGGEIPYDELVNYIGATVRVSTKIDTVREGVLTGASSIAFNLKVSAGSGSYSLAMPRGNVARVELLADAPARP